MNVSNKYIAVLVENLYQELEVWYPVLRFREAGATVTIVGAAKGKIYKSKLGYPITADCSASEINVSKLDALIIPGGYAPDIMRTHPEMVVLTRQAHEEGKIVAAICHGGWMLASADIVSDKNVTCYRAIKDDLVNAGANYHDEAVVCDGKIITSRKPEDLPVFCKAILNALV
jgi:protease I